jgi:50S ribosomal protein L16 3-hydroxylase
MRRLADLRSLSRAEVARASAGARELLQGWCDDGWVHPVTEKSA